MRSIPAIIIFLFMLSACKPDVMKRPPGYIRLGDVQELNVEERYFPELRLLLRKDDRGFYVMSTMCTWDLSTLELVREGNQEVWYSPFSESRYDLQGNVLSGPAKADLPYFKIVLEAGKIGGPRNTLYVQIGNERPRDWRLNIEGL